MIGSTITMNGCETLSGPTCNADCSQKIPRIPHAHNAQTGQCDNAPSHPSALIESVVALMNVASSAHVIAVADANSAARRAGDPRRYCPEWKRVCTHND
jgi:hypothetical protein